MESRDIKNVIDRMLTHVPKEEKGLKYRLLAQKEDAVFTAPENPIRWEKVSEILEDEIKYPEYNWQFEVLSIFTTLSIEELKGHVHQ